MLALRSRLFSLGSAALLASPAAAQLASQNDLLTCAGCAPGGADASADALIGLGLPTPQASFAKEVQVTNSSGWTIDGMTVFAYTFNSPTTQSDITSGRLRIWKDTPGTAMGGTVFAGNFQTNVLGAVEWIGMYRYDAGSTFQTTERAIFACDLDLEVFLPPGTYWLDFRLDSSGATAWLPPNPASSGSGKTRSSSNGVQFSPTIRELPFELRGTLGEPYCTVVPNSLGLLGQLDLTGSADVADNDLTLTARDLPPGQLVLALASMTDGLVVGAGGSQGNLCLTGNVGRFTAQAGPSGMDGSYTIDIDLAAVPQNPGVAVQPGESWYFQAWHRDVGGSSNFTDAVALQFD